MRPLPYTHVVKRCAEPAAAALKQPVKLENGSSLVWTLIHHALVQVMQQTGSEISHLEKCCYNKTFEFPSRDVYGKDSLLEILHRR